MKSPAELELIPNAAASIARLNEAGIRVAVVTNQSAVGRGLIESETLDAIHYRLHLLLRPAVIDAGAPLQSAGLSAGDTRPLQGFPRHLGGAPG